MTSQSGVLGNGEIQWNGFDQIGVESDECNMMSDFSLGIFPSILLLSTEMELHTNILVPFSSVYILPVCLAAVLHCLALLCPALP